MLYMGVILIIKRTIAMGKNSSEKAVFKMLFLLFSMVAVLLEGSTTVQKVAY